MAKYVTESEFKELVRVCLDQNMGSDTLEDLEGVDIDTLTLDEIIGSKAEDAALTIVRIAPVEKLGDVAKPLEGTPFISEKAPYRGSMSLPDDFERLVRFKMSGWRNALFRAESALSPLYSRANSVFHVCGTKDKPLVFVVPLGENGKALSLEFYSAASPSDWLDRCLYAAKPKKEQIVTEGNTWQMLIGDELLRPTVYYAAHLTALAIKDDNAAEKLLAVAKTLVES